MLLAWLGLGCAAHSYGQRPPPKPPPRGSPTSTPPFVDAPASADCSSESATSLEALDRRQHGVKNALSPLAGKCVGGDSEACLQLAKKLPQNNLVYRCVVARDGPACERGDAEACWRAGEALRNWRGGPDDSAGGARSRELQRKALALYEAPCRAGNQDACDREVRHLVERRDAGDWARAVEIAEQRCAAGDPTGCFLAARLLRTARPNEVRVSDPHVRDLEKRGSQLEWSRWSGHEPGTGCK